MSESQEIQVEETEEEKLARLEGIWNRKMSEDPVNFYDMVGKLVDELREKYPRQKWSEVGLYHTLVGSSIMEGHAPESFDAPGGEIEAFLNSQDTPTDKG